MTDSYTFYHSFPMMCHFTISCNRDDLSIDDILTMQRASFVIVRIQLVVPAHMDFGDIVQDERVIRFVDDHHQDGIVTDSYGKFQPCGSAQICSWEPNDKGKTTNLELDSNGIEQLIKNGSLVTDLVKFGYKSDKPLLVLPFASFSVPATKKRKSAFKDKDDESEE